MPILETVSFFPSVFGFAKRFGRDTRAERDPVIAAENLFLEQLGITRDQIARAFEGGIPGDLSVFNLPGDTPSPSPDPVNLPSGFVAGGVSPGITKLSQILDRDGDRGLRLPEFDIIRELPTPGGFPGGGRTRTRTRRSDRRERQARRTRETRRQQRQQRKKDLERLEQLRRLGTRLPEERDFPVPPRPAARPATPPRPDLEPVTFPARPIPATTSPSAPPRTVPQRPPRPQIGRPPSPAPLPGRSPALSGLLTLGAGFFAGSRLAPGTAPQFRPGRAPRIDFQTPPAGSPISTTSLGVAQNLSQQARQQQKKERDRCEKRRRGERRRKCYRGFYKENATGTDFTRWVEVDCVTGRRKDKGKKISERVGKTGRVLKKARRATRRIPRVVIGEFPIG